MLAPIVALSGVALLAACSSGTGTGSTGARSNGEAAKDPAQIVKDAQHATGAVTSVHIKGKGTSGGDAIQVDIVAGQGHGGGTISENGETFQTVLDGNTVYLEADAATWTKASNASVSRLVAGKWIKTTTDNQDFGALAGLLDISQFVSNFSQSGTLTKGSVTTIDGVSVVPVTDHGSDGGILYVAASGTPYIIALGATGADRGRIDFTQYGTAKFPPDPTGAIDLNALSGSATP